MCGFAVAIGSPDAHDVVDRLVQGIWHRGDVTDPIVSPIRNTAMCTRRLRIVDGEHAIQPQTSHDGRLAVSFNGELYNHVALRRELAAHGIRFRTDSDTEVLANALQVWGADALERFVGMYAFVAIDVKSGEFLAARDPFGVKPLYLIESEGCLYFCSEIRPLLQAVPCGDVLLLPPGQLLTPTNLAPFKSPIARAAQLCLPPSAPALDRVLAEAVQSRVPPDLAVATMFSGGIDSTLVTHYARKFRPDTPGYFIGDIDGPDYRYAVEYADRTAFDLRLVSFDPDGDAEFQRIDEVIAANESFEPNLVRGALCMFAMAERMHQDGFRVALCGEGADELFCGYPPLEIAFSEGEEMGAPIRRECLDLMHRVSLQRVDRCSMRFQLETREPFLDPSVAAYALSLDAAALVREVDGLPRGKEPLRQLFDLYPDELPAAIRDRSKVPFSDGAGIKGPIWRIRFDETISDRDFRDGQREFEAYSIRSKEELHYIRKLAESMDVDRVPHLRARAWISFPVECYVDKLKAYAHATL